MQYSSDQYPATNKPGDFSPLGGGLLQQGVFVQAGTQQLPLASSHLQQPLQSMQYVQQTPVQPFVGQSNTQQPYSQHPAAQQYCNQPPASMQYGTQQMPTQYPGVQQPQYQDTWNQQSPGYQQAYMQQTMPMQNSPGLQPGYTPTQSSTPGTAVLGNQYCAQQEQIFFVNEKWASLSRDDFTILDQTRQPVFKLDSSAISLKQKRVLKTIKGQAVCSLKKKVGVKLSHLLMLTVRNLHSSFLTFAAYKWHHLVTTWPASMLYRRM